jgi:pyruvate,water dikinase
MTGVPPVVSRSALYRTERGDGGGAGRGGEDMSVDVEPAEGRLIARWLTRAEVSAGSWYRPAPFPNPVTPLHADFEIGRHFAEGYAAGTDEFALPLPPREWVVVDGYVCGGTPEGAMPPSPERLAAFEARVQAHHERTVLHRWQTEVRPYLVARLDAARSYDVAGATDAELLAHISALSDLLGELWATHFRNFRAAALVLGRYEALCRERLDIDAAAAVALLAGHSHASSEPVAALERLAETVRSQPALRAALERPDAWADATVRALLGPYLERYGQRTLEFDYTAPTLAEQPARAVQLLREALARPAGQAAVAARVDATREEQTAALRGRIPDADIGAAFEDLLAEARAAYAVRDDDVALVMTGCGLMRRALLAAGRRLAAHGLLAAPDDVWFLRRPELEAALAGRPAADLPARANARRREHEAHRAAAPLPAAFGTPPAPPPALPLSPAARQALESTLASLAHTSGTQALPPATGPRELRGHAAARGRYTGTARVVRGEADFDRIEPGDVLVCPVTSPAWTVLFGSIGALVTDVGGLLSHPAITAREFGIPAVVGTRTATASVADGQTVEVDGTTGTVRY